MPIIKDFIKSNVKDIKQYLVSLKYRKILVVIFTIVGSVIAFFNSIFDISKNTTEYYKNNTELPINRIFQKISSPDSVNILIVRFENNYSPDKSDFKVGNAIANRVHQLVYDKHLPIDVKYIDSIASPKTTEQAKKLLIKHNGDLIIFGLYKNSDSNCGGDSICFRTTAQNLLQVIADSNEVNIERYNSNFIDIIPGQIESGLFSLDTLSFNYWIQSLSVLKRKKRFFNRYVELYKIPDSLELGSRLLRTIERADLNLKIGNYTDAIIDYDSALSIVEKVKFSMSKKYLNKEVYLSSSISLARFYIDLNADASHIFFNKILAYINAKSFKKAKQLVNYELSRMYNSEAYKDRKKTNVNRTGVRLYTELITGTLTDSGPIYSSLKGKLKITTFSYPFYFQNDLLTLKSRLLIYLGDLKQAEKCLPKSAISYNCYFYYQTSMLLQYEKYQFNKMDSILNIAKQKKCFVEDLTHFKNYLISTLIIRPAIDVSTMQFLFGYILFLWLDTLLFSWPLFVSSKMNLLRSLGRKSTIKCKIE